MQIVRATGFRSRARQAAATERLRAHDSPDHVAVDVDIAVRETRGDARDRGIDARMDAEGERVAIASNVVEQGIERVRPLAHHVQHRAEHFFL